jgi:hypothetical protein
MKPIETALTNDRLLPAPGTEDHVAVLPITRSHDMVSSCWRMTWRERLKAALTGRVWFDCMGRTHPPIRLRVFDRSSSESSGNGA